MRKYLNGANLPLSMAVFLATDHYDYDDRPNTVSATSLLKPIRQTVLSARIPPSDQLTDVVQLVSARIGTAIHNGVEHAWTNGVQQALEALGYPERVRSRILVNPTPEELTEDCIPVYLEQRSEKQVGKFIVTGKYDFVGDGRVEDVKSTKVYTYMKGTKDQDYIRQGSIYRWLNPTIITRDELAIQFVFLDWMAGKVNSEQGYPPTPVMEKRYPLMSLQETDAYVRGRLRLLEQYWDVAEPALPQCTDDELWRTEPVWKYYKDPKKTARSTKNFDNPQEAYTRNAKDGGKGMVVEVKGQVMACKFCSAFSLCTQKDALVANGDLQL